MCQAQDASEEASDNDPDDLDNVSVDETPKVDKKDEGSVKERAMPVRG